MRPRSKAGIAAAVLLLIAVVSGAFASGEEKVALNVETKKYHCLTCRWAIACTENCVEVTLSEAKRRNGVACKVCGGSCDERERSQSLPPHLPRDRAAGAQ